MKMARPILASLLFVSILGFGAPAWALSTRAWVSGHGTDAAGCGVATSPCRTFQYMHDHIVAAGGEIDVLDPAAYGAVTITKALSIVNDGVGTAGIPQPQSSLQNPITINAGVNDGVYLRGLSIDGLGVGSTGIALIRGGSLTVVNCAVRHVICIAILISPQSGATKLFISNSIVSDNGGTGIFIEKTVTGVISQTTVNNNDEGISLVGNGSVTIVDSIVSTNFTGLAAQGAGATLRIGHSVITGNVTGISNQATMLSYGDNEINGNGTDVNGTLSPVALR